MNIDFPRQIFEKKYIQYQNRIKISPVWADWFHTDGQTYYVASSNFRTLKLAENRGEHDVL
jgi:hypothetical protein